MAQETFEQTQRRLGLVPGAVITPASGGAPQPPLMNARGFLRTGVAIGLVALVGFVGYNVFAAQPADFLVSDKWTTYPGTYFEDSEYLLTSDSLEETQEKGEALIAELQGELAAYGFEWSVEYEGEIDRSSNGYNGNSMLYDYRSDSIIGMVSLGDLDARENIMRIFSEVLSAHDDSTIVINNDEIEGDDAVVQFGSADRDSQALWSAWTYSSHFSSLQADFTVFDDHVANEEEFEGDYWVPQGPIENVYVRVQLSAYYLLSENDRTAFIAALAPYAGETKPEYRG